MLEGEDFKRRKIPQRINCTIRWNSNRYCVVYVVKLNHKVKQTGPKEAV